MNIEDILVALPERAIARNQQSNRLRQLLGRRLEDVDAGVLLQLAAVNAGGELAAGVSVLRIEEISHHERTHDTNFF